jgi:hypothetical protein
MQSPDAGGAPWEWLQDGLFPAGSALLDSIWVFAWLDFRIASDPSLGPGFGFGWLLLAVMAPAVAGRLAERKLPGGAVRTRRLVLVLIALTTFLPVLKALGLPGIPWSEPARWLPDAVLPWTELAADQSGALGLAWLAAGALVVRGVWLAVNEVTPESAARWFLIGLGALLVLFVAEAAVAQPLPLAASPAWLLAAFLAGSLLWLALVRHVYLEQETFRRTVRRLNLRWLATFGVVGVLVLGVAALVGIASGGLLRGVEQGVLLLLQLILEGLLYLSVGIFYVLYAIASRLPLSLPVLHLQDVIDRLLNLQTQFPRSPGRAVTLPSLPPQLLAALGLLAVLALVAGLGRLRARRALDEGVEEERETVWSWSGWWRSLLSGLRARFRRRASISGSPTPAAAARPPDSIRALYRAVLRWSRAHGRPRLLFETPSEFEPALRERLPGQLGEHLTAAYTRSRYADAPPSEAEVDELLQAWNEATERP